jgi:hypothetical protein
MPMPLTAHVLRVPLSPAAGTRPSPSSLLPAVAEALRARGVTVTPDDIGFAFSRFPGRGRAVNLLRGTVALDDLAPIPTLVCRLDTTPLLRQMIGAGLLGFLLLTIRLGNIWFSGAWTASLAVVIYAWLRRHAIRRFKALIRGVVPGWAG